MALPITPTDQWFSDTNNPFNLLGRSHWTNDYQLYEEDNQFTLTIDMPGFDPTDINVAWDDGVLNVAAEHSDENRGYEKTFHRRFRFPKQIDDDAIAAKYNNGVLEVSLPLEENATALGREIPIES